MKNIIKYINNFLLVVFLSALFQSCGEEHALKTHTASFKEANKDWITPYEYGDVFYMKDNNGISQSFSMATDSYYWGRGDSYFLAVHTDIYENEYHYQSFTSNYGKSFSISLSAGFDPFGDELYVDFMNIGFAYDLDLNVLSRIDTQNGYLSYSLGEDGYEEQDRIYSTLEMLDTYTIGETIYEGVLHFTYNDFVSDHTPLTPKEIYIAKKVGLIKYVLNNGVDYERIVL